VKVEVGFGQILRSIANSGSRDMESDLRGDSELVHFLVRSTHVAGLTRNPRAVQRIPQPSKENSALVLHPRPDRGLGYFLRWQRFQGLAIPNHSDRAEVDFA